MSSALKANERSEFIPASRKLEEVVLSATTGPNASFELMKSAMRAQLEREGVITRDPSDPNNDLGLRAAGGQAQPAQPVLAGEGRCSRVIYPYGNVRCEIFGASDAELDEQERRIRSIYGR